MRIWIDTNIFKEILVRALANHDFDDFEDCLQSECAIIFGADYIVTRNIRHFSGSPIPAITPNDFCKNPVLFASLKTLNSFFVPAKLFTFCKNLSMEQS